MYIVFILLAAILMILYLVVRVSDFNLKGYRNNPFHYLRRPLGVKHSFQVNGFRLESPVELTALFMVAVASSEGQVTTEERRLILTLFQDAFGLSREDSKQLYAATIHALKRAKSVDSHIDSVAETGIERFTSSQRSSAIALVNKVAVTAKETSAKKMELVAYLCRLLSESSDEARVW